MKDYKDMTKDEIIDLISQNLLFKEDIINWICNYTEIGINTSPKVEVYIPIKIKDLNFNNRLLILKHICIYWEFSCNRYVLQIDYQASDSNKIDMSILVKYGDPLATIEQIIKTNNKEIVECKYIGF